MLRQHSNGNGGPVPIIIHKDSAAWNCSLLDYYYTPEHFEKIVGTLDEKGVATNIQRLFSPYSDVATMTVEECGVAMECDSMAGVSFHIMHGGDNAALERIAGIIQLALSS